jgi:glucose/arabinose dehydrogenase
MLTWQTHLKIISALILLALGGFAWYLSTDDVATVEIAQTMGNKPVIKARKENFPTINIAKITGWKEGATPVPAAGLSVNAFAAELDHPRWLHVLPNGDVLVAESTQPERPTMGVMDWIGRKLVMDANGSTVSADRITLLRDADGDGRAEFRSTLLTRDKGVHSPFGMQLVGQTLYVANTDSLMAYPFKPGDTEIKAKGEKIIDLPANLPNNHWARNVIASPDGKLLYVTVGSNSNIGENGMESEKNRAAVLEVDPAKKTFQLFATGVRNANGLAYEPINGELWMTVNERDMLGSDGPPDYLTAVDMGGNYGWPWFYWTRPDPRVQPTRPDLQQYVKWPMYGLGPHTASLGLVFAGKAKLGANFARGAFIGQHGSWNRAPASGYKVIYVPFTPTGYPDYKAKPVDVLAGFLDKDGKAQGRPAGVAIDSAGALLVADDAGNRVWRVSAKDAAVAKPSASLPKIAAQTTPPTLTKAIQ